MKALHIALLAGAGVGAFLLLRPRSAAAAAGAASSGAAQAYGLGAAASVPASVLQASPEARVAANAQQMVASVRAMFGAKATSQAGSQSPQGLVNRVLSDVNASVSNGAALAANAYLPGSGALVKPLASAGVSAAVKVGGSLVSAGSSLVKKLKIW